MLAVRVCHLQVATRKAEVPNATLAGLYSHYELTDSGLLIFAPFGKCGWVYVAALGLVCLRLGQCVGDLNLCRGCYVLLHCLCDAYRCVVVAVRCRAFSSLWLSTKAASLCLRLLCALALCNGRSLRADVSLPLLCLYYFVQAQAPTAHVCRRAPFSELRSGPPLA